MAITCLEYLVFPSLRAHGLIAPKPRILELGESNWYGDVPVNQLDKDLAEFVADPGARITLSTTLKEAVQASRPHLLYEIARIFFQAVFDLSEYSTIDPGTPGSTYRFDLNLPVPLTDQFDLTLNIGTAEHVFNVCQFFKTAHDRTLPGGVMSHTSPFTGWPDHGFYCFQPTFFFDLARANNYQILSMVCAQFHPFEYLQIANHDQFGEFLRAGKIPKNSHINVIYRKPATEAEFATPMQGYYAGALSPDLARMWRELR